MNTRIILPVCLVFILYQSIIAQTANLSLLGTGGGMAQGGSTFLSYSFGESFISYNQNNNTWITEGFQQPENIDLTTSVTVIDGKAVLHIFPNPATSQLNVQLGEIPACSSVSISNIIGQTISTDLIHVKENTLLSIDHLQPGVYWISISCPGMPTITQPFIKL